MKILFLNNYFYPRGGSEKVMFGEMRMFREAGHEVAVYSRMHEENQPSEFSEFFPAPMDTGRLRISTRTLRMVGEVIYSRSARIGLDQVIKRFRPDIAHAHNIYGHLSTSVLDILKEKQIPPVLTLHDFKLVCPSYLMLNHGKVCERCKGNRFYNAIITRCHKDSFLASSIYALETWFNLTFKKYESVKYFIAPSKFIRDKVVEFGRNAEKIVHIPNFIDERNLSATVERGDYSLFLGRLSREKGLRTLFMALKDLPVVTHLVVAGDGPDRDTLEKMASENKLPVTFKGHLSGERLEKAIAGAKVVIIPSEGYENAPLSILEVFSYGKSVIGARSGGIPEMIDEGINGYLFEPGNVIELREKWSTFMRLPEDRVRAMSLSARKKIEDKYGAKSHYEQLMDVYHKAMSTQ